jgi:hypothetical protein
VPIKANIFGRIPLLIRFRELPESAKHAACRIETLLTPGNPTANALEWTVLDVLLQHKTWHIRPVSMSAPDQGCALGFRKSALQA